MNKLQLTHIIRAAKNIWSDNGLDPNTPIGILGSQSILLYHSDANLPKELKMSIEADVFLIEHADIDTANIVNAQIGEYSSFHDEHGIYVDCVVPENLVLPKRWLNRAKSFPVDLLNGTITTVVAICPEDLIASKLYANRPKDRIYIEACKHANILNNNQLMKSIMDLPIDISLKTKLFDRYNGIGQKTVIKQSLPETTTDIPMPDVPEPKQTDDFELHRSKSADEYTEHKALLVRQQEQDNQQLQ